MGDMLIGDRVLGNRNYPQDADIGPDKESQPFTRENIQELLQETARLKAQVTELQERQGSNGDESQPRGYSAQQAPIPQTYVPRGKPQDALKTRQDADARLYSAMAAVSVLNNQEKEDWERLNREVFQPWVDQATSRLSIPGGVSFGTGAGLTAVAILKAGASVGARLALGASGVGLLVLGGALLWEGYKNGQVSSAEAEDLLKRLGDPHDVKMVGRQLFLLGQILGVKVNGKYNPSLPLDPEAITVLEGRVNTLVTRLP